MSASELPRTMRAWRTHVYGEPLDVLKLDEVPLPEPGAGELLVRVEAIPLNLNDLERINGGNMMVRPELPYSPGMEVMGRVVGGGDGTEAFHEKRVVAMTKGAHGGYADYAICPTVSAFEMPESVPLPDAAALYFPFHLAWLGLLDRAALQSGESVLIHAAAGGAGSAAIQLAKLHGAKVFATVGSAEKKALCEQLGADVVIDYNETDFAEVVMEATANRGVDVVFDTVGEAVMDKSLHCTAYNGRYLMMGFASDKTVADEKSIVPRKIATGNLHLCGVLLAYTEPAVAPLMKKGMGWNFPTRDLGARITREVVEHVLAGRLHAVVGQELGFEEVPQAITAMARRATVGRTVVHTDR